jgi:DNA-binding MarR family transcriptional regulator
MQAAAPRDAVVESFLVASRALVGVAARSLAGAGDITLPQYRALVVLAGRPGISVTDLAEALDVHASTVTRLCDRLVRKQLVLRTPAVDDRRSIELRLSPGGRRLVEDVTHRRRRDIATITAALPDDVRRHAVEALTAFAEAAGEPAGVDLFGWVDVAPPPP